MQWKRGAKRLAKEREMSGLTAERLERGVEFFDHLAGVAADKFEIHSMIVANGVQRVNSACGLSVERRRASGD